MKQRALNGEDISVEEYELAHVAIRHALALLN